MPNISDIDARCNPAALGHTGMRLLFAALALAALATAMFTVGGLGTASAQTDADCDAMGLGTLDSNANNRLKVEGRWTTEDCDSQFAFDSDAHNYQFELSEAGQVRIDLSSDHGDPLLHLLTEDGNRLAHDDDSGPGVDARIELNLDAGIYMIEAVSGSGRVRGAADFTLIVQLSTNCDPIDLGTVESAAPLTAEGAWSVESCGARFRDDTPSQTYQFQLLNENSVRIDLIAPQGGDPYMYLLTGDGEYIYSDDDGAAGRNSRIVNDLPAGTYLVEATTYGDREHGHELTEFTLTIEIVDEDAHKLKVEKISIPQLVVAGQPVTVHYRVGNAGRTDLPETQNASVALYGRGVYGATDSIAASDGNWEAGASYHSGEPSSIPTSVAHDDLKPFTVTFNRAGDNWAYMAITTFEEQEAEEEDVEVEFNGFFVEFLVLKGFPIEPMKVRVGGLEYEVSAVADEEGEVTTSVTSVITPDTEVLPEQREKALYSAGVQTQMLEGILDRPAV